MKISNLLNRDFKIVQKKKILFLIPAIVIALAAVAMIIYGIVTGGPLNLGIDFSGGYSINVNLSTKLTDDSADSYKSDIKEIVENLKDADGNPYNIKLALIQRQGSGDSASFYIKYKAVADETKMEEEVNPAIQKALENAIFKIIPSVKVSGNVLTATYKDYNVPNATFENVRSRIISSAANSDVTLNNSDIVLSGNNTITVSAPSMNDSLKSAVSEALLIDDYYSGRAELGDITSATMSSELLINAILAISLALVLMLIYIAFRFEVSSGLAAIVSLAHDLLIMFSFMIIFHIELNSTFIAALITILGYSINNTIIIFDRIREHTKSIYDKNSTATFIANQSVKETIWRSINTTFTTFITILMVAIIGVPDIRIFALPIIIGLLSGTYSSICIAPTIWAMWKDRKRHTPKKKAKLKQEDKKAAIA